MARIATMGSPELIRALLAKGAVVNATGEGETALTLAAKGYETEVTRLIREAQNSRVAVVIDSLRCEFFIASYSRDRRDGYRC